jgi:DNA repair exonuclease SbcCD ATPase subunit
VVRTAKQYQDTWNKVIEDTVRHLDVAQDLITFGGHGRQRDIDRANTEEDKSKLVREGSQKAKAEKINGLKNQLQDKEREIRRWKQIIAKYPAVSKQQDLLIDLAKARLEYLGQLQNNLDMASKAVQDSDAALRMFVTLVHSSKAQANTRAADVWDDVLQTLADSIRSRIKRPPPTSRKRSKEVAHQLSLHF